MTVLRQPCGKQDQHIAAYGGMLYQEYQPDCAVSVELFFKMDQGDACAIWIKT